MVTTPARVRRLKPRPRMDVLLTTIFAAAAATALLYVTTLSVPQALGPLHYFVLLPVALAAYRRRGFLPGQAVAGFFSSIFLWQLAWEWSAHGFSALAAELAVAIIFVQLFAYVVSSAGASVRAHETLADAARGWEGLLTRAASLDDVADFIQREAREATTARESALLLRNLLDAGWDIVTPAGRQPLPPLFPDAGRATLAHWIAAQEKPQLITDLAADPRFESSLAAPAAGHRSLLAQPLAASDGTTLAILVLLDRRSRPFGRRELDGMADLLVAGGKALEQAGLLVRTDRALARRAAQLAAIQRTARDLNSALDPGRIIDLTLACAMEIALADAGLAAAAAAGIRATSPRRV